MLLSHGLIQTQPESYKAVTIGEENQNLVRIMTLESTIIENQLFKNFLNKKLILSHYLNNLDWTYIFNDTYQVQRPSAL